MAGNYIRAYCTRERAARIYIIIIICRSAVGRAIDRMRVATIPALLSADTQEGISEDRTGGRVGGARETGARSERLVTLVAAGGRGRH